MNLETLIYFATIRWIFSAINSTFAHRVHFQQHISALTTVMQTNSAFCSNWQQTGDDV